MLARPAQQQVHQHVVPAPACPVDVDLGPLSRCKTALATCSAAADDEKNGPRRGSFQFGASISGPVLVGRVV